MVLKALGLPPGHYEDLMKTIIDVIQTLVVYSFLLDAKMLVDLLKGEYLSALSLV
jgi:hypothetical protein